MIVPELCFLWVVPRDWKNSRLRFWRTSSNSAFVKFTVMYLIFCARVRFTGLTKFWFWWLFYRYRTDDDQPRPKYIFNKCGTNIYFLYSTEVWSITITEFLMLNNLPGLADMQYRESNCSFNINVKKLNSKKKLFLLEW